MKGGNVRAGGSRSLNARRRARFVTDAQHDRFGKRKAKGLGLDEPPKKHRKKAS